MKLSTSFNRVIAACLVVAVLQYATSAVGTTTSQEAALWQLDAGALESSGPFRYIKDAWVLLLGALWPIAALGRAETDRAKVEFCAYLIWLVLIVAIGSVAFLIGYTDIFFLQAGLRWLLLLHASVGLFYLMRSCPKRPERQVALARSLGLLTVMDGAIVLVQLGKAGSVGLGLGAARLTGFFSNAGVAGFFGLAVALIAMNLDAVRMRTRMLLTTAGLFIAMSSGSRSTMIAVFAVLALQAWELGDVTTSRAYKVFRKAAFLPALVLISLVGYMAMISMVDRGGILEMQLASGGRLNTMARMGEILYASAPGELLFGRGLGVGTNTAYTMLAGLGLNPETVRFNWLVDNAAITLFLQVGLTGSITFWVGLAVALASCRPRGDAVRSRRYLLTVVVFLLFVFAGNPFEHYLIMMPAAASLGMAYWVARDERLLRRVSESRREAIA